MLTFLRFTHRQLPRLGQAVLTTKASAVLVTAIIAASTLSAQTYQLATPDGSTSAAFWYLGAVYPSCCWGSTFAYGTEATVYVNPEPPHSSNVQYYTDTPHLGVVPSLFDPWHIAALKALGPSDYHGTYTMHAWATVDGVATNRVAVFINTPYKLNRVGGLVASPVDPTACTVTLHAPPPGYYGRQQYVISDLFDYALPRIDVNEDLENFLGAWASTPPSASIWHADTARGEWDDDYHFSDYLGACDMQNPASQYWGQNGTTVVENHTQTFFVGSETHYSGQCVQIDIPDYYVDHSTLPTVITPVPNQAICAYGSTIN